MSPRTQIGIDFSDTAIHIACATRSVNGSKIVEKVKAELPDGIIVEGEIKDMAQCTNALKQAMGRIKNRAPAVLCIPCQKVYLGMLHLPSGTAASPEYVRSESSKLFPESQEDLHIAFTNLSSGAAGSDIAVAGMRTDVLQQYAEVCASAGIVISSITTLSAAVASASVEVAGTYALVIQATDTTGSITIFRDGHPVDEALLKPKSNDATVVESLKALLAEYSKKGMPVSRILVAGSSDLAVTITDSFTGTKKKASAKKETETPSSRIVVTSLSNNKDDNEWMGAVSAAKSKKPMLNFSQKDKKKIIPYLLVTFIVLAVGLAGYWMYRMGMA